MEINNSNQDKPIIIFCEPFEVLIEEKEKLSYLHGCKEKNMSENQMLQKYDIDYDSFFRSNIRDDDGFPENLCNKNDVHIFLLNYINF